MQLYLDAELWAALSIRSRESGLSISKLVRDAIRECYLTQRAKRSEAMRGLVGIWKDRSDFADSEAYVRQLRQGARSKRIRD